VAHTQIGFKIIDKKKGGGPRSGILPVIESYSILQKEPTGKRDEIAWGTNIGTHWGGTLTLGLAPRTGKKRIKTEGGTGEGFKRRRVCKPT